MKYDDLTEAMQEFVRETKYNSSTITSDISDELENAIDEKHFVKGIHDAMARLVEEATSVRNDAEMILRTDEATSSGKNDDKERE